MSSKKKRGGGGDKSHMRNKSAHTVLVVPSKSRKYRKALYCSTFVLIGAGLTMLMLGVWMSIDEEKTLLPSWLFNWLIILGSALIVFGGIAGRGATVAHRKIETGARNWWLCILFIMLTIFIIGSMLLAMFIMIQVMGGGSCTMPEPEEGADPIEPPATKELCTEAGEGFTWTESSELQESVAPIQQYIDDGLIENFRGKQTSWWDIQKWLKCCGFRNNTLGAEDGLATGKFCTKNPDYSAPPCWDSIMQGIRDGMVVVIIIFSLTLIIIMIQCCSSCCLACWIKAEEPVYT